MSFEIARRRKINSTGRPMILRRLLTTSTKIDVAVIGYQSMFSPAQVGTGSITQGDGQVAILNDEIAAASWPAPPRPRDQMVIDNRIWAVLGATAVYDGSTCIGYSLFVRGG